MPDGGELIDQAMRKKPDFNVKAIAHIVPRNETYLAYFHDYDKHVSVSKLKINKLRGKIAALLDE